MRLTKGLCRRVAVPLIACASLIPTGHASAQSRVELHGAGPFLPVGGPVLGGRDLLWAGQRPDAGYAVRRAPGAGSSESIFNSGAPPQRGYEARVGLAASAQLTLAAQYFADLRSGPLAGGPVLANRSLRLLGRGAEEVLFDCSALDLNPSCADALDADGSVGVFSTYGPEPVKFSTTVRDFSAGEQTLTLPVSSSLVRIAGRFVAYPAANGVVVYDRLARAVAYRAEAARGGRDIVGLDVNASGSVVVSFRRRAKNRYVYYLGSASVSAPVIRQLPGSGDLNYQGRMSGREIAFARDRYRPGQGVRAELGVARVGVTKPRVLVTTLALPAQGTVEGAVPFDFDGTHLAWVERSCAGVKVARASVSYLRAHPRRKLPRCKLGLTARPVARGGRLVLSFSCRGYYRHCGAQGVRVRTAKPYRIGGRVIPRGTRLTRGGTARRPTLTRTGRRLLLTHPRAAVVIGAVLNDGAGPGPGLRRSVVTPTR